MTSYDRHSSYDSPYRSGRHVPLGQDGLTAVATASESRADITSPYPDYNNRSSLMHPGGSTSYNGMPISPALPPQSPGNAPYSPGLRSQLVRASSGDGFEMQSPIGEIPMQSFEDGQPPAPPVTHSWKRIDAWAEDNYPELWDQLCEPCTVNDINELEHQLDCSLPADVRDSLQVHDGQERGGMPTGIIFGCMLLDCEEMVQDWDQWRKVNHQFLLDAAIVNPSAPSRALGGSSEASSSKSAPAATGPNKPNDLAWREKLIARQESVPPNSIRKAYAHAGWIPLVRDWGGNNLAVDLAPGPKGHWGQIILFGRDYDTKYVVARSWAHFLAVVADDLNSGKWFIDEDTQELKLREFKATRVEPGYMDILRWRMDQKYGRRAAKRRSAPPSGATSPPVPSSPYSSASEPAGEVRGRSLHRLSGGSPLASPMRPGHNSKASPLARVTEEGGSNHELTVPNGKSKAEKLVEVDTPRPSGEEASAPRLANLTKGDSSEEEAGSPPPQANGKQSSIAIEEPMKEIEI
ncbi:glucan synthesis regulatory protein [Coniella lustricola]|uniref:Glucan synthesis regulatory protein n=1 Tax=Coniella lustricola TaxID=2025994 RepID=A0A2T3A0H3_9PEZI|nr:glucan synthesis regulatory protein [Coniella lustricola]